MNTNNTIAAGSAYYVAKIGSRYVGNDGSQVDRQRDAFRMPADDRIAMMRAALDTYYLINGTTVYGSFVPDDQRLRLVRVNPKADAPIADAPIDRPHVYVVKVDDQYLAAFDMLNPVQREAIRFNTEADAQPTLDRIALLFPHSDTRSVRVNLKSAIVDPIGFDGDDSNDLDDEADTYFNDDNDRDIDTNDDDDRPFVHVIKAGDYYYQGSDLPFVASQRSAFWFVTKADAQATIDREATYLRGVDTTFRIVRVRLNSDQAVARYTQMTAPIAAAAIDRKYFYVAKSGDHYLDGNGDLTQYQRKALRFSDSVTAQSMIDTIDLADGRIVKVNAR